MISFCRVSLVPRSMIKVSIWEILRRWVLFSSDSNWNLVESVEIRLIGSSHTTKSVSASDIWHTLWWKTSVYFLSWSSISSFTRCSVQCGQYKSYRLFFFSMQRFTLYWIVKYKMIVIRFVETELVYRYLRVLLIEHHRILWLFFWKNRSN